MSSNLFHGKRFLQLCKQHFIHQNQLLMFATIAYMGVIIIVLSITQVSNGLEPNNLDIFQGFLVAFVVIFGVLYVGHSFPALRSKESTMNYLMVPGSLFEKFVLEFVTRIVLSLLALPVLYWISFHFQGYIFSIFTTDIFNPIGVQNLVRVELTGADFPFLIEMLIVSSVLLASALAFTGAAMFTKQPLVKTLFSIAVIIIFFGGYFYIALEHFGLGRYNPPKDTWLIPSSEETALQLVIATILLTTVVMLIVAYRKLKEREV